MYCRHIVSFGYIIANTLHKGDNKDDDDNTNNDNNNNNNKNNNKNGLKHSQQPISILQKTSML